MRPALLLLALPTATAAAQRAPTDRGAFIVTLGADTVGAERYTRTATTMEGDVFQRAPAARVMHYAITLDRAGRPTRAEVRTRRPDGSPLPGAPLVAVITFRGDSAVSEVQRADSTGRPSITRVAVAAAAGALPGLGGSWALYELGLAPLRAAKRASDTLRLVPPGGRELTRFPVTLAGDSAVLSYAGDPMVLRVDARGRVTGVDGARTTNKIVARRVADVDVAAMAQAFAARPAMGPASPTDSVRAAVGAAQVAVVYGRPSARGRSVWGGLLVPYGQVWRTGANAATAFRTSADLVIGGARVPAGSYTLYAMPTAERTELIINKQTGQWGTVYTPAMDLARVPLAASSLGTPAEQFTIAVEPARAGGPPNAATLVLRWADRQYSVPVQAAP